MKLGILLNNEINELLDRLALRMGTSKRNIILLALSDVEKHDLTLNNLNMMEERIHGLKHPTNITINETLRTKLLKWERYGRSIRKFFGLVICDYFYRYYGDFFDKEILQEDQAIYSTKKAVVQISLDIDLKNKIMSYCEKHSLAVNSLFSHYIMDKPLNVKNFKSGEKEPFNLSFSIDVRERLIDLAKEQGMSINFYGNLIAQQINKDLDL